MYLDPGSWGLAAQVLIGFLIAIPAFLGIYWKRIWSFFRRGKSGKSEK